MIPLIVVIWKLKGVTPGWYIRQFSTQSAASNFAAKQRSRTDIEHVRQVDIQ